MIGVSPLHAQPARPNVIHILADDLGWGSVGFNGQKKIQTPTLDRLAREGMVFNNSYSATVCAPTRAMLYTGFHQGHAPVDSLGRIGFGFRAEDVMTPQLIAPAGYSSAIFGKWGFGASGDREVGVAADPQPTIGKANSLPNAHGFTDFYGYLNHSAAHDYYYGWIWQTQADASNGMAVLPNNGGPDGSPEYMHDLVAARSEQFIADRADSDEPFYMQVCYTIPHFDLDAIATAPGGYGIYADRPWTDKQKAYAAMITRMDASIASLLAKLDDPNGDGDKSDSKLANTLIMFTSDNGPTPEHYSPLQFFDANGVCRGGKRDLYEGGIKVPTLAAWPGVIAAGSSSDYRTDVADFMATVADLAGVETPVGIDGVSLVPTLTGQGAQRQRPYLVFEHHQKSGPDDDPREARWAIIRQDGMKLIRYEDGSSDLFNVAADPGESAPLDLKTPANAELAATLEREALAEGVHQDFVKFRTWTGADNGDLNVAGSWSGDGTPTGYWSAVVANDSESPQRATVRTSTATLGLEVRGAAAPQVADVSPGVTLTGRNEVRISAGGEIALADSTLETNRWINIRQGGTLSGTGVVAGDVDNAGTISPGRSTNLPKLEESNAASFGPVGTLKIDGNLVQRDGATLALELAGAKTGEFDRVAVQGKAELAGNLALSLIGADGSQYRPAVGDTLAILTASEGITGQFDDVSLPPLAKGLAWHVSYAPKSVTLEVRSSAASD